MADGCGRSARSSSRASIVPSTSAPSTGAPATTTTASTPSAAVAAWAAQTKRLCIAKRAAIAKLGHIHITYAGIARVGLGAVKRAPDSYLGKLPAVPNDSYRRRQRIATPPSLRPTMSQAVAIDLQSQNATRRVRTAVASSKTAAELSAGFNAWLATLQRLSLRGVTNVLLTRSAAMLGCWPCRSIGGGARCWTAARRLPIALLVEQRDAVLCKLAPEFQPMWAPLWIRELTYTSAAVLTITVLVLAA